MSESNKKFSIQPINEQEQDKGTFQTLSEETKKVLQAHSANPGPVISDEFNNAQEEGTKEERHEKAKDLNK